MLQPCRCNARCTLTTATVASKTGESNRSKDRCPVNPYIVKRHTASKVMDDAMPSSSPTSRTNSSKAAVLSTLSLPLMSMNSAYLTLLILFHMYLCMQKQTAKGTRSSHWLCHPTLTHYDESRCAVGQPHTVCAVHCSKLIETATPSKYFTGLSNSYAV